MVVRFVLTQGCRPISRPRRATGRIAKSQLSMPIQRHPHESPNSAASGSHSASASADGGSHGNTGAIRAEIRYPATATRRGPLRASHAGTSKPPESMPRPNFGTPIRP